MKPGANLAVNRVYANLSNYLLLRCKIKSVLNSFNTQVYTRLNNLHLCASHRDTITSLDVLGKGYDTKGMQWSSALIPKITLKKSVLL